MITGSSRAVDVVPPKGPNPNQLELPLDRPAASAKTPPPEATGGGSSGKTGGNAGVGPKVTAGGAALAVFIAYLQSDNAGEFAANAATNIGSIVFPPLAAVTAKDDGSALFAILLAMAAKPVTKYVLVPAAKAFLTTPLAPQIAIAGAGLAYGVPQASARGMSAHMLGARGGYQSLAGECMNPANCVKMSERDYIINTLNIGREMQGKKPITWGQLSSGNYDR